jgi:hypothetical protein
MDWVLRPQWGGLLTETAPGRRLAASPIGETHTSRPKAVRRPSATSTAAFKLQQWDGRPHPKRHRTPACGASRSARPARRRACQIWQSVKRISRSGQSGRTIPILSRGAWLAGPWRSLHRMRISSNTASPSQASDLRATILSSIRETGPVIDHRLLPANRCTRGASYRPSIPASCGIPR